jgi:Ca-activated chloride channel family protein
MSGYQGRRRAVEEQRSGGVLVVAAIIAVLAGLGATLAVVARGPGPSGQVMAVKPSDGSRTALSSTSGPPAACSDRTVIAVPEAYVPTWTAVAGTYATSAHETGRCAEVQFIARNSKAVAAGEVGGLDAWIPEDTAWSARLSAATKAALHGEPQTVAMSPVVLSMPKPMADAVGVSAGTFAPQTLAELITLNKTWADFQHPEWGALRLALPDPDLSATGAVAFAALTSMVTAGNIPTTIDYANPTPEQLALIRLEHRVAATPADDAAVLTALGGVELNVGTFDPRGAGMALTTEAVLLRTPTAGRVGVYLDRGAISVAMPLMSFSSGQSEAVERFAAYLASDAGVRALTGAGLRTAAAAPGTDELGAAGIVVASGGKAPAAMPADLVSATATAFTFMHTRLSSLVLLDASGSMNKLFPGTTVRRIDLVIQLAKQTLMVASPQARSGLLTFRGDARGQREITLAARLQTNGSDDQGALHSTRVLDAVTSTAIHGGTPLYDAILQGYRLAQDAYNPAYVNQVVVLTDGDNRDTEGSISREGLIQAIKGMADSTRPIKLILLGYGPEADMTALQAIAAAVGGKAVKVGSLDVVAEATRQALFTP